MYFDNFIYYILLFTVYCTYMHMQAIKLVQYILLKILYMHFIMLTPYNVSTSTTIKDNCMHAYIYTTIV